jgi:outer membrane protein assembly factor BamB
VLWFGGTIDRIFPDWDFTHSAGPSPLVLDGRMFILVGDEFHAADIYTGRHLWQVVLPPQKAKRRGYDHNNYVAVDDRLYVVCGNKCLWLDPKDGSELGQIEVPQGLAGNRRIDWGEIRICKDRLIGIAGKWLLCVNCRNGQLLWKVPCRKGLFSLAVGDGKVFCVDYLPPNKKGVTEIQDLIVALDVQDGNALWEKAIKVRSEKPFQPSKPQLSYSDRSDTLIVTMYGQAVFAYSGDDGTLLWNKNLPGCTRPPILQRDLLITHSGQMYESRTGSKKPARLWNGINTNWASGGARGCGRALASEHIATIRDAHVSYYDLESCRQTYLRGIRSGCTNSLIPAGGLLNAPNFARGCSCNYSVFSSVGWAHMPEAATWR